MKPDKDPIVVDLASRRKAVEQARKAARKPPKPAGREPLLGGRPRAGLILVLVAAVMLALWLTPLLL